MNAYSKNNLQTSLQLDNVALFNVARLSSRYNADYFEVVHSIFLFSTFHKYRKSACTFFIKMASLISDILHCAFTENQERVKFVLQI